MRLNSEKCVFSVQGARLRKPKDFQWTDQCKEAFQSFKTFLTTPPILQRPDHKTDLFLYLAVAESAISAVIVQEHQKVQTLIYFISRVLQDAEKRYQMIEKLALALVTAAWLLPEDKDEARKMRMRSAKFVIIGDELFKRGISTPLLKCLTAPQAAYVIEEIHRAICGMHSGARSMATRVLQAG
uniref:Retrovirus-related Pol polyprotein from transposon 412 family n=1 Tax=Cajanus cajan TaxID=3821 RepID=A0A151R773_CAJCA|nr:Retrovirus-related Pol polyprotein from transposon 412 family [Cajanus cajan]